MIKTFLAEIVHQTPKFSVLCAARGELACSLGRYDVGLIDDVNLRAKPGSVFSMRLA